MPDHASVIESLRTGLVMADPPVWIPFVKNCEALILDDQLCPIGPYKMRPECKQARKEQTLKEQTRNSSRKRELRT